MKRIIAWVSVLLCISLFKNPLFVMAGSTDQASEKIDLSKKCTLALSYTYDELAFTDADVELYQIATVDGDLRYTVTEAFSACKLDFNGISSQDEWNSIRSTITNYIASAPDLKPIATVKTDAEGKAVFGDLIPGLYITVPVQVTQDGFRYYFASVLSALPTLDGDNTWLYDVSAKCKPDVDNPTGEDIEYRVLKLWKDDGNYGDRPDSVEINIIRDGKPVKTVVLSDDNNWSFSWYAKDDGSVWSVTEKVVPNGYTMTLESRETTFTVVNSSTMPPPPESPKTGDTSNIGLYVFIMCMSGTALVVIALTQRRRRHE